MRRLVLASLVAAAAVVHAGQNQPEFDEWTVAHFERARQAQATNDLTTAADEYKLVADRNPKFAEVWLNLGIVRQLQNNYSDAITALNRSLAIKPDLAAAKVLLGISYYMVQDFRSALEPLRQVLAENPRERQAGLYLGLALLGLDRPGEAASELRRLAKFYPGDLEIVYHLGEAYHEGVRQSSQILFTSSRDGPLYPWAMALSAERKSDTYTAILEYSKVLAIDPDVAPVYGRLAVLFESAGCPQLGQEAGARQQALTRQIPAAGNAKKEEGPPSPDCAAYQGVWNKVPRLRNVSGHVHLADSALNAAVEQSISSDQRLRESLNLYLKRDLNAAARGFRQFLASRPDNWAVGYLLVRTLLDGSDFEPAEDVLETSLAPFFDVPSVALIGLETRTELAFRAYDQVVTAQPDSLRARLLRAKSLAADNQPDPAITAYREILQSHPDLPQIHLAIAQVYSDRLDWSSAIAELKQELELSPDNGMALALLGHAYSEEDRPEEAIAVLTKVLARYPKDASALADMGKACARNGDIEKAIKALELATLYDKSQYKLHYRLFLLYRNAGRQEAARKHLAEFQAGEARRRMVTVADRHP